MKNFIAPGEKIPFSTYMERALYTPGVGYYAGGAHKFGPQGDFVTAPEISPLFGKCLSKTFQQADIILELGAGTGKLALSLLENNPRIKQYWILEISSELQHRQKETLQNYLSKITWLTELPKTPFSGIILANEVIDAFPATKFLVDHHKVYEYYVTEKNGALDWLLDKPSHPRITEFVQSLNLPSPYTSEMHLWLKPWIKSLSDCLQSGLILLLDYGFPRSEFYHPDRTEGTLMCHYQHKAHTDVFFKPGEQDITAHVDFTAIAEAAVDNNLDVAGYTSQGNFLIDCGITDFIATDAHRAQTKILTHPGEMGELIKVIALTKNWPQELIGFRLNDRRYGL